jgi:fructokinase
MHVEGLAGRIDLDDARRERFRRVFLALGVALSDRDVDAVASSYRSGYMMARRALDGAAELLAAVRPHARIGIVTNNLLEEQRDKLDYCGLAPFVDALIASEDVGVSKPDRGIFDIALARMGVRAEDAVMVGDAWVNDIVGAASAGIRAVWFNPERKPLPASPPGVAEIHSLTPPGEILPLLLGTTRTTTDSETCKPDFFRSGNHGADVSVRIGIDLGGTKIEAIALRGDGTECFRRRIASPRGDYDGTVRAIADLVNAAESATGERGTIGIGIPGAVSPATGLIKNANSTWLIGRPLHRDLEEALGRPVRLANDANCFALSEATDGAGAGAGVVFGAILGTGTGGGIVAGGQVMVGANAVAGEWGHIGLPWPDADEWPGPLCYCGRHGCIETFLSGSGLQAAYGARPRPRRARSPLRQRVGMRPHRRRSIYTRALAKALAVVINLLDPDVIVLGGGLSNIEMLTGASRSRGLNGYSRITWRRASRGRAMAIRAACAARPGCGLGLRPLRPAAWLWALGFGL